MSRHTGRYEYDIQCNTGVLSTRIKNHSPIHIAEGNNVAVHVNNHVVRVDVRIYDNEMVSLMKIENGLIVEIRELLHTIHVNKLSLR